MQAREKQTLPSCCPAAVPHDGPVGYWGQQRLLEAALLWFGICLYFIAAPVQGTGSTMGHHQPWIAFLWKLLTKKDRWGSASFSCEPHRAQHPSSPCGIQLLLRNSCQVQHQQSKAGGTSFSYVQMHMQVHTVWLFE